jgi:hypothetical protein
VPLFSAVFAFERAVVCAVDNAYFALHGSRTTGVAVRSLSSPLVVRNDNKKRGSRERHSASGGNNHQHFKCRRLAWFGFFGAARELACR